MAGHRRDEQDARLLHIHVLAEAQQRAEGRDLYRFFMHGDNAAVDVDLVDPERRTLVPDLRVREQLISGRKLPHRPTAAEHGWENVEPGLRQIREQAHRHHEVRLHLVGLIKH